jgi:hypothetical protein
MFQYLKSKVSSKDTEGIDDSDSDEDNNEDNNDNIVSTKMLKDKKNEVSI